jgi:eukaryotic-like serine/threonine-protein kinase
MWRSKQLTHISATASKQRRARPLRLNDRNVCTLYDVGPDYLVMEFVAGETRAARLKRGALTTAEAVDFATQIGAELHAAYERRSCIAISSARMS